MRFADERPGDAREATRAEGRRDEFASAHEKDVRSGPLAQVADGIREDRLLGAALEMTLEVANPGDGPAPYACGFHPGFRWPFARGGRTGARVVFERAEAAVVPVIAPGGLISAATRPFPLRGNALDLDDALFVGDALCFLEPASRSLRFEQADGSAIEMDFTGFGRAALWTRPGAPFLCLEAWTGYSDPEGFAGELFDKPAMRTLAPGERARHKAIYRYFAA